MKRLLVVAVAAVVGFSFANAVPLPKSTDPYDEDLLRVKKPMEDVLRGDVADRRQAAGRLIKLASEIEQLVNTLKLALRSPDEIVRVKAAKALQQIGPSARAAVPYLVRALQDSSADVRAQAALTLWAIGPVAVEGYPNKNYAEQVVPALIPLLNDKNEKVRQTASGALLAQGHFAKAAVPAFVAALREKDAQNQRVIANSATALFCLGQIGPDANEAVPALLELVQKPEQAHLRRYAVRTLGMIAPEDPNVLPVLLELAAGKLIGLREPAIAGLGRVGPKHAEKVVPTLIEGLDVSDVGHKELADEIQHNAIYALEQLGPAAKVAIPKIEEILKDPKTGNSARAAAEIALRKMRPSRSPE